MSFGRVAACFEAKDDHLTYKDSLWRINYTTPWARVSAITPVRGNCAEDGELESQRLATPTRFPDGDRALAASSSLIAESE